MKIQIRHDTAANWAARNPVLGAGELGEDTTNMLLRAGDGVTPWATLPSYVTSAGYTPYVDVALLGANVVHGTPHLQSRTEPGSITRLQGQITTATAMTGVLFTLPAAQWPVADQIFEVRSSGAAPAQVLYTIKAADGTVTTGASVATGNMLNFDGVTFGHV